jgi:ribosomal peptide maturation radical SAM protein 1
MNVRKGYAKLSGTKMKKAGPSDERCVTLVSAPWPLYSRPSIQLGTLKSYLKCQFPQLRVQALPFYLKVAERIGYGVYQAISERTWLAESVYGALLFPERKEEIERIFSREAKGKAGLDGLDFQTLLSQVKEVSEALEGGVDWGRVGIAGFSVCLCQLTSSLYFISRIKERLPDMPVVVGGSMFSGDSARQLIEAFAEVDFVVHGEGEVPFSRLVRHLREGQGNDQLPSIPGIISRKAQKGDSPPTFCQLPDLSTLPPPDYDEYFQLLKTFALEKRFFPTLPAEVSRGCWWRSSKHSARAKGCAFCNLNLQWEGYRSKDVPQVVSEVDYLTSKHKTLSVAFMDNLLPLKNSDELFLQLRRLEKDFRLFAEIRATTPLKILRAMKAAGTDKVQVGIEALSSKLLRKLNKGTSAIQNVEIMKHCEALGIENISNLIFHFPGSDAEDVEETLWSLEFVLPFRPLRFVHFWLGLGSPVWQAPRRFGLTAVFNHPNYDRLFPRSISRSMKFMIQSYRGDLGYQRKLWRPVKKRMRAWKKVYQDLHSGPWRTPALSYRDGREFLIIRQRRPDAEPLTHRLLGTSRKIYLFCEKNRSLKKILDSFPGMDEAKIRSFLKMMVDKRLMFEENGRYLSLAVRVGER